MALKLVNENRGSVAHQNEDPCILGLKQFEIQNSKVRDLRNLNDNSEMHMRHLKENFGF